MHTTLISAEELAQIIDQCVVFDVQHDLFKPEAGPAAYAAEHIPGAFFLDNTADLAGPKQFENGIPATGRHPLPNRAELAQKLAACGVNQGQQVVVYDGSNGMYAVRLWWLLNWLGHSNVAVLDGGLGAWKVARYPVTSVLPSSKDGDFVASHPTNSLVPIEELVADVAGARQYLVIDARAGERYRGEVEPLDRVAGHIPGAVNRPFQLNLRPDGRFKPAPVLRQEFEALIGSYDVSQVINQCGSGVTACHNILAMTHAGLTGSSLYPGSWSEWSASPDRPVATGPDRG